MGSNGCDSTVITNLTIKKPTTSSQTLIQCAGFTLTVGANTYDTTGIYTDTLTAANGCDSTVTTDLTIINPNLTSKSFEECAGFSVTVGTHIYDTTGIYTDTLCTIIFTTNLTIKQPVYFTQSFEECVGFSIQVGTNSYNKTGIYTDIFIGSNGCDSIITTNLTIKQQVSSSQTIVECEGFTLNVGTNTYDTTGVYTDVFVGKNGCDSIVTTNLTILRPTSNSQTFTECAGFSIRVGNNTYNTTGVFTDVLVGSNGCDSTVTTDLTIKQAISSSQTIVECAGFSITVGANTYDTTGIYTDVFTAADGCDSTVITNLTIKQPTTSSQTFSGCKGFSVMVGQHIYNASGVYIDTLTGTNGCDSIITTNLSIIQPISHTQTFKGCKGLTVTVGTNNYSTTGIYTDVLVGSNGCDSIVITDLTITDGSSQSFVECKGFAVKVGNNIYTETGIYTDVLTSVGDCDSTVTTNLTIKQPTTSSQTIVGCVGTSIIVGKNTYTKAGTYTDILIGSNGCDSTVTTNLIINTTGNQSFVECAGFSVKVGENIYDKTGIYTNVFTGTGCTIVTNLTIIEPIINSQTIIGCFGSSIVVGTNSYDKAGIYTDLLTGSNSCDSTVITNLSFEEKTTITLNGTTLTSNQNGATYQWIDCNNGNAAITDETNQSFSPTANGDYAVIVSFDNCSDTSDCMQVTTVGIEQQSNSKIQTISLYPNPTNRFVNINLGEVVDKGSLKIINIYGQEIKSEQFNRKQILFVDMENIATGLYLLKVETENNTSKTVTIQVLGE